MKKHLYLFLIWLAAGQLGHAANPWGSYTNCSSSFSDVQFVTGKAQVAGTPLESGDWVCAFDPGENQVVAASGVTNSQGSFALVIYECTANADGINDGEQLTLQFYDASADLFYTMPDIGLWESTNNGGAFPGSGFTTIYSADGTPDPQMAPPPPLPVDWLFFQTKEAGEKVDLAWATAQETNSDFFSVEHSRDGRHFEPIGKVEAAGNSADERHYFFMDDRPNIGVNYYRVKQVDADGRFEFSAVRAVEIGEGGKLHIFPNPASHVLNISFGKNFPEGSEWSLFDFSGHMVKYGKWEDNHLKKLDLEGLPVGHYFLKLSGTHQRIMERIIKR